MGYLEEPGRHLRGALRSCQVAAGRRGAPRAVRLLVTGGAGFVGSHLAIALKKRWPAADVVALDNLYRRGSELNLPRLESSGVVFHRGDVRDRSTFPEGPFDF